MTPNTATESYELQSHIPSAVRLSTQKTLDVPIHTGISTQPSTGETTPSPKTSNLQAFLAVLQLCTINFLASFTNGIITVGLPTIARSIDLPRQLYLWPSSVY